MQNCKLRPGQKPKYKFHEFLVGETRTFSFENLDPDTIRARILASLWRYRKRTGNKDKFKTEARKDGLQVTRVE